jgi:F-type H+-transporting ATPase subunit b
MDQLVSIVLVLAQEGGKKEEESGNFLVSPNVGLMLWTLFAFAVTLFLLRRLAFPRIQEALDKRRRTIEESIDHANRTREEADQLLQEYRERLREARGQADDIVARARKASDNLIDESKQEARKQREEMMSDARRDIEQETARAINEIRKEVAQLTVQATEKVTRKSLTPDDHKKLIDDALEEFDFSALPGGDSEDGGNGRASG